MNTKVINEFPDYEISETGRVFSNKRATRKELKVTYVQNAYALVSLSSRSKSVHRLVALAFIANPENKPLVNHIDGDKHNNVVTNLEWVTHKENSQHACDTGLNPKQKGETNAMAKLSNAKCYSLITEMLSGLSNEELAEEFSLHPRYVSLIRGKKRWIAMWDDDFRGIIPPKSSKPRTRGTKVRSTLSTDTQMSIISRIHLGASLKLLAEEYGLDPSVISRVKAEKAWPYAHNKFKQTKAQRLSNTSKESQ